MISIPKLSSILDEQVNSHANISSSQTPPSSSNHNKKGSTSSSTTNTSLAKKVKEGGSVSQERDQRKAHLFQIAIISLQNEFLFLK